MEWYIKCRYKSRWVEIWETPLPCEQCFYSLLNWDIKSWVMCINDINHLTPPMRWKRTHRKDGTDLLWMCSRHHRIYHENNSYENNSEYKKIVEETMPIYKKLWHKEKIRALVTILYNQWKDKIYKRNVVDVEP